MRSHLLRLLGVAAWQTLPPPTAHPPELEAWVHGVGLAPAHQTNLLDLLTGDEFGMTAPEDLLDLEPAELHAVKHSLPLGKRSAFQREVDRLKAKEVPPGKQVTPAVAVRCAL